MAIITARNIPKSPVEQYFSLFLSSTAARGVKDKALQTYKQQFHSISKRMDVNVPMDSLNVSALDNMILKMREEGLSDCSINSYTHFSWCNLLAGLEQEIKQDIEIITRRQERKVNLPFLCPHFYLR